MTTLNLQGSARVKCDGEEITIDGSEFSLEEADNRHIGEGDYQYETLHIYFDPEERFKILIQSTLFEGKVTTYAAQVHEGSAVILEDELEAVEG
ncbi:hypothetical protein [Paraburkholderia youngii]|uniref:hypothetical protein n=1 Tax=Paraburkholderia youngii TaxID=2782701 RepID=UPI003D223112